MIHSATETYASANTIRRVSMRTLTRNEISKMFSQDLDMAAVWLEGGYSGEYRFNLSGTPSRFRLRDVLIKRGVV